MKKTIESPKSPKSPTIQKDVTKFTSNLKKNEYVQFHEYCDALAKRHTHRVVYI